MELTDSFDPSYIANLHRLGGDPLISQLLEMFQEGTLERLDSARTALAAEDLDTVSRSMHSLKSSSGNLGALKMYALSGQIEMLADGGESSNLVTMLDELEAEYQMVLETLNEAMKGLIE